MSSLIVYYAGVTKGLPSLCPIVYTQELCISGIQLDNGNSSPFGLTTSLGYSNLAKLFFLPPGEIYALYFQNTGHFQHSAIWYWQS